MPPTRPPCRIYTPHLLHLQPTPAASTTHTCHGHLHACTPAPPAPTTCALPQSWVQAANLAISHQRHRMHDVISVVSQKLLDVGRFQAAADLHESIDDFQGAQAACAWAQCVLAQAVLRVPALAHFAFWLLRWLKSVDDSQGAQTNTRARACVG